MASSRIEGYLPGKDHKFPEVRAVSISEHLKIALLTAAASTPVGPPPQTTKLNKRLRSSGEVVGKLATSKLSISRNELYVCSPERIEYTRYPSADS